jgi:threonine dehydratase
MLTLDQIYHASYVLKDAARKTDLIYAANLCRGLDTQIYLKTENLQTTGSFKLRGAYYKISQLTEEQKKAGILACSAGNHAQGVALSAARVGVHSVVCMPDGAPISKVEATRAYGAEVCLVPGTYDDAYARARQMQQETGATFIHPFDDDEVIAGQGTIGLEILDQLPDVDAVLVPVGGGGLISGVAFRHQGPQSPGQGLRRAGGERAQHGPQLPGGEGRHAGYRHVTFADGIAVKRPGRDHPCHDPEVCGRHGHGQRGRDRRRHPGPDGKAEAGGRGRRRGEHGRGHVPQAASWRERRSCACSPAAIST